ncbi:MAG TPA: hypothetical protein VIF09_13290 [Polyangiaceae bacterium]|jgi:hypothetical protein
MVSNTVLPWWMGLIYLALLATAILLLRFLTARRNARYFAEQQRLRDAIAETVRRDPHDKE